VHMILINLHALRYSLGTSSRTSHRPRAPQAAPYARHSQTTNYTAQPSLAPSAYNSSSVPPKLPAKSLFPRKSTCTPRYKSPRDSRQNFGQLRGFPRPPLPTSTSPNFLAIIVFYRVPVEPRRRLPRPRAAGTRARFGHRPPLGCSMCWPRSRAPRPIRLAERQREQRGKDLVCAHVVCVCVCVCIGLFHMGAQKLLSADDKGRIQKRGLYMQKQVGMLWFWNKDNFGMCIIHACKVHACMHVLTGTNHSRLCRYPKNWPAPRRLPANRCALVNIRGKKSRWTDGRTDGQTDRHSLVNMRSKAFIQTDRHRLHIWIHGLSPSGMRVYDLHADHNGLMRT
jgi:hypothetical protein